MHGTTKILTGLFFVSSLNASAISFAAEENSSGTTKTIIAPSSEAGQERHVLGQLAVALAAGSVGMRPWRGSPVEEDQKYRLQPPIPGMDCSVDRILSYVSCYSAETDTRQQADRRFRQFVEELNAVLPVNRWRGNETEPRINSVLSYTFEDQVTDASIDLDLIEQPTREAGPSYVITIYGWGRARSTSPQLIFPRISNRHFCDPRFCNT